MKIKIGDKYLCIKDFYYSNALIFKKGCYYPISYIRNNGIVDIRAPNHKDDYDGFGFSSTIDFIGSCYPIGDIFISVKNERRKKLNKITKCQ